MSMITATGWVPRGHAAAFPTKYVFDDDEYGRIAKLAKLQLEDAEEDLEEAKEAAANEDGGVSLTKATGNSKSSKIKKDKE
jgi:periodic tryptophan protein 1